MERGIRGAVAIEGPAEEEAGRVAYHNPQLSGAADHRPQLSTLSIDIETTLDAKRVFSVALAGCGTEEVWLVHSGEVPGAHCVPDEGVLLETLFRRFQELDPDVVLGWSVVDFDIRVLVERARALGVREHFGRVTGETRLSRDPGYARGMRADMPGRVVLDGLPICREALRLPDYRLDTVAREVLGRGKLITGTGRDKAEEIQRQYREEPEALVAYNLEDARLVTEILEHEGLLDLCIERSLLTGMPLDRVSASIASFDQLYLPELNRRGRVAPCVDASRKAASLGGGAVLDSVPGLSNNVALFDFKSLYPSLIRTFHLDPLAFALGRDEKNAVSAPNGARFSRTDAILPELIEHLMTRREAAKSRGDRHADQAIKIMMNSLYGVLGASACRFFEPEIANAITGFGQQTLRWTRDAFQEAGTRVIYGDTDSVFVDLAGKSADALRKKVEAEICARVHDDYGVEPKLVLELERVFDRFFLPRVRGGKSGSKKRYAGWTEGKLHIAGLEAVRRDWPELGKRLQRGLLERLFRDEPLLPFAESIVTDLRSGSVDRELVYVKRLRKGEGEYTKTTPPHVQAARKAGRTGGVIRYVITQAGPEPVVDDDVVPSGIDYGHYVERVLRPIADAILPEVGETFGSALGEPSQLSLL
jgi:DNA polymerase-2